MGTSERAGFVRFQQERARKALAHGQVRAARAALQVLRSTDFVGGLAAAEALLAVMLDGRSCDEEIEAAAAALIRLQVERDPPTPDT